MRRVEIAVTAPIQKTLLYTLDDTFNFITAPVGMRVLVPLGNRLVTGYILSLKIAEEVEYKLKEINSFLDSSPLFHENQVEFFRWIANYYHYPIGEVIKTALPSGLNTKSVKQIRLGEKYKKAPPTWPSSQIAEPEWYDSLVSNGELSFAVTRKILSKPQFKKPLNVLTRRGIALIQNMVQRDSIKIKEETCLELAQSFNERKAQIASEKFETFYDSIKGKMEPFLKLSEAKTIYHFSRISQQSGNKTIPRKDLTKIYPGAGKALKSLDEKKLVIISKKRIYRDPFGEQLTYFPKPEQLSENQARVLFDLEKSIDEQKFSPFLLHGITGSGKTEVYLRAAERTLKQGRDVIVLVPEIALATQLEAHFVSRFEGQVVLLHSGLTPGEKLDQWSLASKGQAKIVIGARSAIFAPLKDPGLIVVDEEHDHGFKQDDSLHYQGRDLAVLRGSLQKAVVILGSATPSITSYYHALQGKYTLLEMTTRVGGKSLPEVQIVDLSKKNNKNSKSKAIRRELRQALRLNLKAGKQSLLLLNRRGFSGTFLCQECGTTMECVHCHVSLTLHKRDQLLVCHYCGYTLTSKTVCTACSSTQLVPVGFGTERIEEEIQELVPDSRIARIDSDTAKNRKNFLTTLKKMHRGEIDILIGTQMIAKGHHFPNVTLVGVIWADSGLNMPDFRASERVFQLISQVTGRAGRGDTAGRVIIQTMRPDHYALQQAQKHQYSSFFDAEIQARKAPAFPPHVRLVAIRINGEKEFDVRETARSIATACRQCTLKGNGHIEILGPAPSPLDRLQDKFRWQILLRGESVEELGTLCNWLQENKKHVVSGQATMVIDVDPENMM